LFYFIKGAEKGRNKNDKLRKTLFTLKSFYLSNKVKKYDRNKKLDRHLTSGNPIFLRIYSK